MASKRQKNAGGPDVPPPRAERTRPSGRVPRSPGGAYCRAVLLFAALSSRAGAQTATTPTEYEVMAQFLHRFAMFLEWPKAAFADAKSPIIFGVAGDDPFGDHLEQTLKGKTIDGRPLVLKRFKDVKDIEACHVLFVSKSLKDSYKDVYTLLKNKHTVTVSDIDDFAEKGGVFRFFLADKKVRFKINLTAAVRAGVTISSRLLQVGVPFKEEKRETK